MKKLIGLFVFMLASTAFAQGDLQNGNSNQRTDHQVNHDKKKHKKHHRHHRRHHHHKTDKQNIK